MLFILCSICVRRVIADIVALASLFLCASVYFPRSLSVREGWFVWLCCGRISNARFFYDSAPPAEFNGALRICNQQKNIRRICITTNLVFKSQKHLKHFFSLLSLSLCVLYSFACQCFVWFFLRSALDFTRHSQSDWRRRTIAKREKQLNKKKQRIVLSNASANFSSIQKRVNVCYVI